MPLELTAHIGAQLRLLARGLYYEGVDSTGLPTKERSRDALRDRVATGIPGAEAVGPVVVAREVFHVLSHRMDPGKVGKLVNSLPGTVRDLWMGVAAVELSGSGHDRRA